MGKIAGTLVALLVALAFAGCGIDVETGTSKPAAEKPGKLPPIEHNRGPGGYRSVLKGALGFLNEWWSERFVSRSADAGPPNELVAYWTRNQDKGCAGGRAGWRNAQYCPTTDSISWDGYWVYNGLYRKLGETAVAFLLAHEYGHLVQKRLGIINKFPLTIEGELNADCLAGAWMTGVDRKLFRFTNADFESLYLGILAVADPGGVPWTNPAAHGTARERRRAVIVGADHGLDGCLNRLGPGFSA
ncbi:MAG: neutral zinc metallopeptidase [Thermoleophilia bacterium]|nr:neutral zinc metallopeptidase [Thermoleophilia bacterium]